MKSSFVPEIDIDPGEVLRYLGYRQGQNLDGMQEPLARAISMTLDVISPRYAVGNFSLVEGDSGIGVEGTTLTLTGEDIRRHLEHCDKALLLVATLGTGVEKQIRHWQHRDMTLSLFLDSAATTAIESLCDGVEDHFRRELDGQGLGLTRRFSPGYGDLPIEVQRDFLAAVDATRAIGLTVSSSGIMIPRKSVSAVMGILPVAQPPGDKGCESCPNYETCPYKKEDGQPLAGCPGTGKAK